MRPVHLFVAIIIAGCALFVLSALVVPRVFAVWVVVLGVFVVLALVAGRTRRAKRRADLDQQARLASLGR